MPTAQWSTLRTSEMCPDLVEGLKVDGSFDEQKLGRERRVTVLSPRQFFEGKIDEAKEIEFFLRRFNKRAPSYPRS